MKFLIIKSSSLGDIIHSFDAIVQLKKFFPDATIDWVVEKDFVDVVRKFSLVDNIITISTKKWRKNFFHKQTWQELKQFRLQMSSRHYNAAFDLQGNIKSAWILSNVKAEHKIGFGFKTIHEWPNLFFTNLRYNPPKNVNVRDEYQFLINSFTKAISPQSYFDKQQQSDVIFNLDQHDKNVIDTILHDYAIKDTFKILVCPGSNWQNKQLPCETMLAFLHKIQEFQSNCSFLFTWGNAKEKLVADRMHSQFPHSSTIIDRLPIATLQSLMGHMQFVIAMDSLPLHLCATTKTPSFAVFGPSLATKFGPQGHNHYAVQASCPYGRQFNRRCPKLRSCSTGKCMSDVDAEYLFQQFKIFLIPLKDLQKHQSSGERFNR